MADNTEDLDAVVRLIQAAEHVLTESKYLRDSQSSARFRRALRSLATAIDVASQALPPGQPLDDTNDNGAISQ